MVESMPPGLSPACRRCSVGYVKEIFELLDSVLRGGKRCKFKITVV